MESGSAQSRLKLLIQLGSVPRQLALEDSGIGIPLLATQAWLSGWAFVNVLVLQVLYSLWEPPEMAVWMTASGPKLHRENFWVCSGS